MKTKRPLILTIIVISMFQMGMVALSPVVSSITTAFPGTSSQTAQLAMTFLPLILVVFALLSSPISKRIGRRTMAIIGLALTVFVGIAAPFLTVSIGIVFLWSGLLGAGGGLFIPVASSLMVDYFDDQERQQVAGWQTAGVNLGGVLLSILAGVFAGLRWNCAYLVYLLAFPAMILCLRFLPKQDVVQAAASDAKKHRIPGIVWTAALQTFLFAIIYFAFTTNISLLLVEKGQTSATVAGIATAVFMLGGCIFGFVFPRLLKRCKDLTPSAAFVLLALSYLLIYLTDGLVPLMIGAFVGGGSLSIIFPYFVVSVGGKVDPSLSVLSTSLILSVAPNFGSFVSPVIVNFITSLVGGATVNERFLVCTVTAVLLAVLIPLVKRLAAKQTA